MILVNLAAAWQLLVARRKLVLIGDASFCISRR